MNSFATVLLCTITGLCTLEMLHYVQPMGNTDPLQTSAGEFASLWTDISAAGFSSDLQQSTTATGLLETPINT